MLRVLIACVAVVVSIAPSVSAADGPATATGWQTPPEEVMEVLLAPQLPWVWTSPTGEHLLLADPILYPPLAELAGGDPLAQDPPTAMLRTEGGETGRDNDGGGIEPLAIAGLAAVVVVAGLLVLRGMSASTKASPDER